MTPIGPLLKLANVTKCYNADSGASIKVLRGISLQIERGDSLAIVGPSGSGKSTLLHLIGTLDRPTTGEILLNDVDLGHLDEGQLAQVRCQHIGFIFQAHFLLPQCTVLENVLLPTLATPRRKGSLSGYEGESEAPTARAERLLARVGLADRLAHRPGQLSGGESQRVAVVRALINRPQLLLADEPTGSLDHASAQRLGQLLFELNREEGVTLIVVTHSRSLAGLMRRVFELKDGCLMPAEERV